jgi:hypothetical protein
VAILGSLVNAHLTGQLINRLRQIGIPPHFQNIVITAISTGRVPGSGSSVRHNSNPAIQTLINKVINAAFGAFGDALHQALLLSGVLILVGAVVAVTTLARRSTDVEQDDEDREPSAMAAFN